VKGDDFRPAITYIGITAILGAICYGLVVGRVERIQCPAADPTR